MINPAPTESSSLPRSLTQCAACGEPLYAGSPMRSVPGGAMHVGCHLLEMRKRSAPRHLELVVDNTVHAPRLGDSSGLKPAA
jgi:hypothetical protein